MNIIDRFLNSITMYRLVLYGLSILSVISIVCGFLGFVSYSGLSMIILLLLLVFVSHFSNIAFAKVFNAQPNVESVYITAFILFFLLSPVGSVTDALIVVLVAMIAMGSKYLLAYRKIHIFNPAAIAAVIVGVLGFGNVVWWVGNAVLFPFVLIFGLLIVRKVRRFRLFFSFLFSALLVMSGYALFQGTDLLELLPQVLISWPIIFFATVMLTEPLTTPATVRLQIIYGVIVGIIFSSQWSLGPLYPTPELALVIGNIFTFLVSTKYKAVLSFVSKVPLSHNIAEFNFSSPTHPQFLPGQYLEWTLPHSPSDSRGNRRFFTIASSPTEREVKLGVRLGEKISSFKTALRDLQPGARLTAAHVSGEFILPKDTSRKLVFIAGGIGVTPFRSMAKYLTDVEERRDIVMFYSSVLPEDFVYGDIFAQAHDAVGLKTVLVLSDPKNVPPNFVGETGFITKEMLEKHVPDHKERLFYLSGPNAMVVSYKKLLRGMGVGRRNIKTDYFPGF